MNELLGLILFPEFSVLFSSVLGFLFTRFIFSKYNLEILQVINSRKTQMWGIVIGLPVVYIILLFFVGNNLALIGQFGLSLGVFRTYLTILLYLSLGALIIANLLKSGFSIKGCILFVTSFCITVLITSTVFTWIFSKILVQLLYR